MTKPYVVVALTLVIVAGLATILIFFPHASSDKKGAGQDGWHLPKKLREVSGLAATKDGTLLTVTDEEAIVYEFDPVSGEVSRRVDLGLTGDFEGIAYFNDEIFLITSQGILFRISPDGRYVSVDTGVIDLCEIEGLHYQPFGRGEELLLLCKTNYVGAHEESLQIFRFDLATGNTGVYVLKSFVEIGVEPLNPSGITIVDGEHLILAARQERLLRLDEKFELIEIRKLKGHRKPEGIAEMAGTIYVANEGKKGEGGRISDIRR